MHDIIHRKVRPDLFDTSDVLILPIVNLDGYTYINNSYGKKNWNIAKRKRKNMNFNVPCK